VAALTEVFVKVSPDTTNLEPDLKRRLRRIDGNRLGGSIGKNIGGGMRLGLAGSLRNMAGLMAGAFAAVSAVKVFGGFITDARESEKVARLTASTIKATGGAARITAAQVGQLATAISNKTGKDDEAIQSGQNMLLCLEESAQALTRDRGWVTHEQLNIGDDVLIYDPEDGTSRWEPIQDFYRYRVDTELIRWKSRQINVATTPHHRWWTTGRTTRDGESALQPYGFKTTEQISGHQYKVMIGGGAPDGFAQTGTLSDDLIELLGWVMTEGCFVKPQTPGHISIHFCQSETANPQKVVAIRSMVASLREGGHRISETSSVAPYNGSTMCYWHFSGPLARLVRALLPGKKLTPELFGALTAKQAELLLDTLIAGDGHTDVHGHRSFIQKDRQQLDMVAMLAAMLGIRTTIGKRPDQIIFTTTNHAWGHQLNATTEHYEGIVWCPQVRTGIFLARNNGKTFWTGNTFKNVADRAGKNNDIFTQSSSVLTDMVAAMNNGEVTQANMSKGAIQLGKALNDPIKGVGALSRVGVTFTDQQKKQIKAMVAAGNVAGAQKIILAELKSEFGGAAVASSDMGDRMKVALGNLGEKLGGFLLPLFERFTGFVTGTLVPGMFAMIAAFKDGDVTSDGLVGAFERVGVIARRLSLGIKALVAAFREGDVTSDGFVGAMERIGIAVRGAVSFLQRMAAFAQRNAGMLQFLGGAILGAVVAVKVITTAVKVWAAAQALLNVVLTANPIGVVVVAIGALIGALVVAYRKSETFKRIVDAAFRGVAAAGKFMWNNVLQPVFRFLGAALRLGWIAAQTYARIVNAVFSGVGRGIKSVWERVIRPTFAFLVRTWLTAAGAIVNGAAKALGWVPGVGPKLRSAAREFNKFRDRANAALGGVRDQSAQVRVTLSEAAKAAARYWGGRISASRAKALLIKASARGNLFEQHNPQIARGGEMRVWAEPETGGEAYIPLRNDARRPRAKSILGQVADKFGMRVESHARGGITVNTRFPPTDAFAMISTAVNRGSAKFAQDIARGAAARMKADIAGGLLNAAGPKDTAIAGTWAGGGSAYVRTYFRGKLMNERTAKMLAAAERIIGTLFRITQGSYSTSVAASAGTHAGGGVVDVGSPTTTGAQSALRRVGFAAWIRLPSQGPWGRHIHAVAIGDPSLSAAAARQVTSFRRGGNGLGGFDRGGWLMPGYTLAYNGTGRPERVSPPGGGAVIQFHGCTFVGGSDAHWENVFVKAHDMARRKGRL